MEKIILGWTLIVLGIALMPSWRIFFCLLWFHEYAYGGKRSFMQMRDGKIEGGYVRYDRCIHCGKQKRLGRVQ